MSVRFAKLWKLLIDNKMKRTEMQRLAGISGNVLSKLGKDEYVSLESIEKICLSLHCDIGDIMEIIPPERRD